MCQRIPITMLIVYLIAGLLLVQPALAEERGLTLITETAEEGFELAIALSRKGVTSTQTDKEVLHRLREHYANDADALIEVSHVIAVHFRTVAKANNYWRE